MRWPWQDEEDDDGEDWQGAGALPSSAVTGALSTAASPYYLATSGTTNYAAFFPPVSATQSPATGVEGKEVSERTEPYIAYRAWVVPTKVAYPFLRSTMDQTIWRPGKQQAVCRTQQGGLTRASHEPPVPGCGCGFWAYDDPMTVFERFPDASIMGAVVCWGKVIKGTEGLRAEYVQIAGLMSWARLPIHDHLEKVYQVSVVDSLDRLEERAEVMKRYMMSGD